MLLHRVHSALAVVGVMCVAVGCSGAGGPGTTDPHTGAPTDDAGAVVVEGPSSRDTLAATPSDAVEAPGDVVSIPPVPETGVAGINADDGFCRAWSEFAGSFQALATATDGGRPATELAVLEIAAAATIHAAVEQLGAEFPMEVAGERDSFVDGYVGPLGARATDVLMIARSAGLDPAALDTLGAAWLAAITEVGVNDPDLRIEVPSAVGSAGLANATAAVAASVPTIFEDPALITEVEIPATIAYITSTCPDRGTLGGFDIVQP